MRISAWSTAVVFMALASVACDGTTEPEGTRVIVSVVSGAEFSCALDATGAAWCWGTNDQAQLGRGGVSETDGVGRVSGGLAFDTLAAGDNNVCGLSGGRAWCWGHGAIVDAADPLLTPTAVEPAGLEFVSLSVGGGFGCGLTALGEAWCWGRNDVIGGGQLGNGTITSSAQATRVLGDRAYDHVSAGFFHACATAAGEVWCWGAGLYAALGRSGVGATASPLQASLQLPATSIVAGAGVSCASVSGAIHCWGINMTGQLGRGVRSNSEADPAAILSQTSLSGLSAAGVNSIVSHVCGMANDGRALCWGANEDGQLGRGSSEICEASTLTVACAPTPAAVDTELTFDAVAAGEDHTCALSNGAVWCWGSNEAGQLGAAGASSTSPVRVEIGG